MYAAPIPNPGQLVTVRQRGYVVTQVQKSALPPDPLVPLSEARPQHLVELSSVEDDGLGEELQVIWELEPGVRVFERATLPEPKGFDDPARLDTFLDAVRWGAVASADANVLHAPFRSGITIEDYQLDPVVRALQMPRVNLLIADDVGLGKTIEAGLVVQELLLRHRARTILVVCPAGLQLQWRDQMRDKFGLEFRIVDSDLMKQLRRRRGLHVNPWTHFPRLITSQDFIKRDRPMRLFRETLPPEGEPPFPRRYDLLIVDEAHNVAPSGTGAYAIDSLRTQAIRTVAPHFEHKLFLTATPHNGYTESFTALLELLDNQRFHREAGLDRQQLSAVMVRRLKSELPPHWDGTARFPKRELTPLEVAFTDEDRQAHRALCEYSRLRQEHARSSDDRAEQFAAEFVLKLLKKRMFSSPAAFLTTLEKHLQTLRAGGRLAKPAARSRVPLGILRRQVEGIEEAYADDDAYEEASEEVIDTSTRLFSPLSAEEERLLDHLHGWAQRAAGKPDSKAEALFRFLDQTIRPRGRWGDQRVIVFTEYRATQKWLTQLLAHHGLKSGERLSLLYGGMIPEDRERVKAAFQASPDDSEVRLLLATDAASEGIDLQNHCSRLIHYEIPWNPNRMEQRNGRVDRHGQRAPQVDILHFVGAGYAESARQTVAQVGDLEGDLEFLMRAALKVNTIREDLGKVGPVIAAQVEEAMLGRRTRLDTGSAERAASGVKAQLSFERKLREQIEKLHDQLMESRKDLHLTPEHVKAVVQVGLELAGQPPLEPADLPGVWPDSTGKRADCPVFRVPELRGSWAPCTEGLAHPHTGVVRPITFDHDLAEGRDDVVLAHLNHRLVQMCLSLLRAEIWATEGKLHRVTARLVPARTLEAPAVVAHGRLVVLGADNTRLHEEIVFAGGLLKEGKLTRMSVTVLQAALDAGLPEPAPAAMGKRLAELWPSHQDALFKALEARVKDRSENLDGILRRRADREVKDLTTRLLELLRLIKEQLDEKPQTQLELNLEEEEQRERNHASLKARAEEIPAEIEREAAAIRARFEKPSPRLFPVAVTYLVPEHLARGR